MVTKCRKFYTLFWLSVVFILSCAEILETNGFSAPVYQQGKKSYKNYKVLRTDSIGNSDAVSQLLLLDGMLDVEFWKYPTLNQSADILTSPKQLNYVENVLSRAGLRHEVIIEDADSLLKKELDDYVPLQPKNDKLNFQEYHRYGVISQWLQAHAKRDPTVSTQVIGKSTEGREIHMLKLSSESSTGNKSAIFIDGGMHAREWISPATVLYIMNKLITDSTKQNLVDKFDWYFVPVVNVDGYEFTHTNERFWRKTRSKSGTSNCIGVDPNRNWNFHWKESGSSNNPCSQTYHGPKPFSEPETAALAQTILSLKDDIKLYLTFHSYSQMWLIPWSHSRRTKPDDYRELLVMATKGKHAIENTFGTRYRVGTAPDLLYAASGGSDDWAKGVAGIKYSYTVELRDTGRFGFALPSSQIQATGEETFNGIEAVALALDKKLARNNPHKMKV